MAPDRLIGYIGMTIAGVFVAFVMLARVGAFNTSYEEMAASYAQPPSRFLDVVGVRVHLRDEGAGPAILMLHSSQSNLHIWDAWADELKKDYRVVRIDWPPYGLTVDDTGETGMVHASTVVEAVVDQLRLNEFVLVGSSSGATLSVIYASGHPEKVRAIALSTLPLNAPPSIERPRTLRMWDWIHQYVLPNYLPSAYWRLNLEYLYGDPSRVKPAHISLFTDVMNIKGKHAAVDRYQAANVKGVWSTGAGGFAGKITAPILLQWGDLDPVLPRYLVTSTVAEFRNSNVTVLHYPLGHYPQLEDPDATVRDLRAFLASLPRDGRISTGADKMVDDQPVTRQ